MELKGSQQEGCPFCGISFTDFEFHLNLHEDCKLMDGQSKQLGKRKRRGEMEGLEVIFVIVCCLLLLLIFVIVIGICYCH